ncbi:MAG TPA: hypothetical protein VFY25_08795 [Anaerolineales bacterium]|nr:hypothetical protein [Anaerolineales bacterium]
MVSDENQPTRQETETPAVRPGTYSPVTVYLNGNSLGAIFLGILSFMLLIGWMSAECRYRTLLAQLK